MSTFELTSNLLGWYLKSLKRHLAKWNSFPLFWMASQCVWGFYTAVLQSLFAPTGQPCRFINLYLKTVLCNWLTLLVIRKSNDGSGNTAKMQYANPFLMRACSVQLWPQLSLCSDFELWPMKCVPSANRVSRPHLLSGMIITHKVGRKKNWCDYYNLQQQQALEDTISCSIFTFLYNSVSNMLLQSGAVF